jgi:hypothetical protein
MRKLLLISMYSLTLFFVYSITEALSAADYGMYPSTFTPSECEQIIALFQTAPAEFDDRNVPLLPGMEGEYRVSRTNRFDVDGQMMAQGRFDWIYRRLLTSYASSTEAQHELLSLGGLWHSTESDPLILLRSRIAFNLLHEFQSSEVRARSFTQTSH